MTTATKVHYFPADGSRVKTELQPNGEYTARMEAESPVGWGRTRLEAIADLVERLSDLC